ncbi:MAG: Integral membrane protein MviN [Microgenomates group bacterium Gr01-1014_5]|nr:MAG: Integral membrane protein MviN [Microgenomates group bacterium Gr01-1014_5]
MVKKLFEEGKNFLYAKQTNILSAAAIIMFMVAASRFLGLIRNRVFVHYFAPEQLDSFLAAFQLPDMLFDLLILGAMSSVFIPVFGKYLSQDRKKEAWHVASVTLSILLLFFTVLSVLIFIFAEPVYSLFARGFTPEKIAQTVYFTRWLLVAQLFFVVSYLLTAVLEAHQRFLVSATAPLFYNIGIILATAFLAPSLGMGAAVLGVILGSFLHLAIQLPFAIGLGFRPKLLLDFRDPAVREISKLAIPRIVELSFFQVKRLTDLFTASLVVGGLTYFKFGDSLASLPVGLFGLSIAKASFPQLSLQSTRDLDKFKQTFISSFKEILFLVVPTTIFLAVLRLPLVRLAFGAQYFDWQDTLDTGYVVSAFCLGGFAYALSLLLNRGFYALQDTATPVKVSIFTIFLNAVLGILFVVGFKLPIWSLALAYSIAGIVQIIILYALFARRVGGFADYKIGQVFVKIILAAGVSGLLMYILLKVLDRSAWDQKLSFFRHIGLSLPTTFDLFILDTRYTVNLVAVTFLVALFGFLLYLALSYMLRIEELQFVLRALRKISRNRLPAFLKESESQNTEPIAPTPNNGA